MRWPIWNYWNRNATSRLGATLRLFEEADHSFHVPARTGRKDSEIMAELLDAAGGLDGNGHFSQPRLTAICDEHPRWHEWLFIQRMEGTILSRGSSG
jgi:hypothetical protein